MNDSILIILNNVENFLEEISINVLLIRVFKELSVKMIISESIETVFTESAIPTITGTIVGHRELYISTLSHDSLEVFETISSLLNHCNF